MAKKPSIMSRMKRKADDVMAGPLKMGPTPIRMVHHYTGMLMEQLKAMLPITLLQVKQHHHSTQLRQQWAAQQQQQWLVRAWKEDTRRRLAGASSTHTQSCQALPRPLLPCHHCPLSPSPSLSLSLFLSYNTLST